MACEEGKRACHLGFRCRDRERAPIHASAEAAPWRAPPDGSGGFLRGRPPFAPLILAAFRFASDFDLPPSFPSRAAALFFTCLGEPFAGVVLADWKAREGQEFGAFDVSDRARAGHVIDRRAVETVVGDFSREVFHGEEFAA